MQARAAGTARNDQGAAVCYVCPVAPSRCERGKRCEWCLAWVSSIWWGKASQPRAHGSQAGPKIWGGWGLSLGESADRGAGVPMAAGICKSVAQSVNQPTHPNHTLLIHVVNLLSVSRRAGVSATQPGSSGGTGTCLAASLDESG